MIDFLNIFFNLFKCVVTKSIFRYFTLTSRAMATKYVEKLKQIEGKLFINGQYVDSKGGNKFQVFNPATEQVIGYGIEGTQEDVDDAVKAAREAFDNGPWRKLSAWERANIIYKFAELIEANAQWLAYYQTLNNGKPLKNSRTEDVPISAQIYRYFAGVCDKIKGSTLNMSKGFFGMTIKEPVGVVGQIIPWNYPLLMMTWKCAPALAVGCTIVLKPAEQTPFTALMLGKLANQAGIPPGVLNIVTGFGKTGAALSQHKLVNKVSFTGSTEVGYIIMRNSHKQNLKPITLELGGKSANIILPDADLQEAVAQATIVFSNAGQSCVAGSRTFVHEDMYDKFIQKCKVIAESIKVGDPMNEQTNQGPQVSKEQFDRVMGYIESGVKQGARVVTGGKRVGEKGFFIAPTIFADVQDQMKIAKEEIFGPVMSIFKWKTEDQVIKRANSLPYGLGAGIVTKSIDKVLNFIPKLQAGTVYVNCYDYQQGCTPFGGVKDSGIGKDLGDEGLEGYMVTKTVIMKSSL